MCATRPAVPWWWCGLFWCHEVGCGVRWSNVVGCEVTWGEVVRLVARCHVMSSHVMMSYHVIWCDLISCVVLRDVMQCDAMWCALMWWAGICCEDVVKWCDGLWVCDAMWLVAMSRCVVRSGCVMWWFGIWPGHPYYKILQVLHSATKYLQVLLQFHSVPPRTTPILQILLHYYSVLHSTNTNTPYYKLLIRLIVATHETSSTMCEATRVTLEPHQILCLPPKKTVMIDPRRIWNNVVSWRFRTKKHQRKKRKSPPTRASSSSQPSDAPPWVSGLQQGWRNFPCYNIALYRLELFKIAPFTLLGSPPWCAMCHADVRWRDWFAGWCWR